MRKCEISIVRFMGDAFGSSPGEMERASTVRAANIGTNGLKLSKRELKPSGLIFLKKICGSRKV